ncbi:ITA2B protein, partial [Psilopogon haemacephalus]|nr:ITA2B protein [Psilopogon haemacephalus]
PELDAELQLDRLKPKASRRVLLLQSQQPTWHGQLAPTPGAPPVCHNLTAYLRDGAEFKDKLSPVALSLRLALPEQSEGLVLYGDTSVQAQVWGHLEGTSLLWPSPVLPSLGCPLHCPQDGPPVPLLPPSLSPLPPWDVPHLHCPQPLPGICP